MKTQFNKLLLASSIALVLATSSATVLGQSDAAEVKDARQQAQIETTYELSPYLRAHDIDVIVVDGKATLTGTVDEAISKDLAREIALGVPGVTSVDNQIEVKADYVRAQRAEGERSFGELVDDASVSAAVKSKLLWSAHTDGLDTKVETRDGAVRLTGTADSSEARALAERLAMNTRGVRSVDNQIKVVPSSGTVAKSRDEASEAGQSISDTWITTKIKSTYLMSSNIHSNDISVTTKDGEVTLSGETQSSAEKALAIELARNIKGVKSVASSALKPLH